MLNNKDAIIVNQYAQGIIDYTVILEMFNSLNQEGKRMYLTEIEALIMQSKAIYEDIEPAIVASNLKPTFTPCVLLKRGIERHKLKKVIELPEYELNKTLILFLNLFKIAYSRRFRQEYNSPEKWWYWDLSDKDNIDSILKNV